MPLLTATAVALSRVGEWTAFTVRALLSAVAAVVRPGLWLKPLFDVLIGGLPLALVLGFALGAVIWMHTRGVLERTAGASELLPTVLAAAVLLELAPIGSGLIVASRTGASLGAELGAMRIGEQVDALELLGVSPMARLVGPRVLACVLGTPLLHGIIAAVAIGSGYAAESFAGRSTWLAYQTAVLNELYLHEVVPAGLKTFVFGGLVGATGCFVGLRAHGGSEGVGTAATNSVVACSLLVLASDVLLVGLIRAVG